MNIDWSKAPEGATHWHPMTDRYSDHWFKLGFFCVCGFESGGWVKDVAPIKDKSEYVERLLNASDQLASDIAEYEGFDEPREHDAKLAAHLYCMGYRKCP